jgi:CTP:molybdopterin cytidylyltransferase MocA
LFARPLFDELAHAPAEKGARYVVNSNPDRVLEVDVRDPAVLMSIDTPEDYVLSFGTSPQILAGGCAGGGQ